MPCADSPCFLLPLQVDAPLSKFVEDLKARQQGSPQVREGAGAQARSGGGSCTQTVPQLPTISETLTLSLAVPAQVDYVFSLKGLDLLHLQLET